MRYKIIFVGLLTTCFTTISLQAAEKALHILAIGDSTTAGTPAFRSPAEAPPNGAGNIKSQYAYWMLQRHPEWTVANRGVNGQRSDQILSRLERELDATKPDTVIILAGVNDVYQGVPLDETKANLLKMYEMVLGRGCRLAACSVLPYNVASEAEAENILELNRWVFDFCQRKGALFCDTCKAVSEPTAFRIKDSPDGLHPSVEGYRHMGEAITGVLETDTHIKRSSS